VSVVVSAPARLHLGFIDLNGRYGRIYGSIGVALERPRCVIEARAAGGAEPELAAEVRETIERLGPSVVLKNDVSLRVLESIPRHVGLGSGTQRRLAVGLAVAMLADRPLPAAELGRLMGRGQRSGVGIAAFHRGGFVVDAGRRCDNGVRAVVPDEVPPVMMQHAVPEDWHFVVVVPAGVEGLSGTREQVAFRTLPPMRDEIADRISRLTLMKVIPGVLTDDVAGFGQAVTEIQTLVGEYFAPVQGGVYATAVGARVADFARANGAAGVGQSSWGPAVFALVRGETPAADLAREIGRFLGPGATDAIFTTRADNTGATWRTAP
jgi:beta-ribofuranosylaminobenzene 5'-phosphate synthase